MVTFYSFSNLDFQPNLSINYKKLCQCETKKGSEIGILLKSKDLRFSKDEFVLVIGLRFGPILERDQKSLHIRDTYFKGENKVCNDELKKVFISL